MVNNKKRFAIFKAGIKVKWILPFLDKEDAILDIGSGNGAVVFLLRQKGFDITATDINDKIMFKEIQPVIANAEELPLDDNCYDSSLLLTMLHHTKDSEAVLKEAQRVSAKYLIVIEDVYETTLQKYLTYFTDSLVNMEFIGHPHTNRTEAGWEGLFKSLDLRIVHKESRPFLICFRQVLYVLEIKKG